MRLLLVCPLVLCGALAQAANTASALQPTNGGVSVWRAHQGVQPKESPQEPLSREPDYRSDKPLYVTLELGDADDRFVTVALDESGGAGKGYDTLHVDANNNGNLTDDPPVKVDVKKSGGHTALLVQALPVTVKYRDDAERTFDIMLKIGVRRYGGPAANLSWSVIYHPVQHMEGLIAIGGKKVLAGVYDAYGEGSHANGCFNDYGIDRLRLDLDGDGKLDRSKEEVPLSRAIAFDGKLWELAADGPAAQLTVKPFEAASGLISVGGRVSDGAAIESSSVELSTGEGYAFSCRLSEEEAFRAPVGEYRISRGRLNLTDRDGVAWRAGFSYPTTLRVEADEATPLVVGMPITVEPIVTGNLRRGARVEISHRLVGVGGEVYETLSRAARRDRPEVKIVDAEGIDVAEGKMEYG